MLSVGNQLDGFLDSSIGLTRRRAKHVVALLARRSRRREAKHFLNVLPDGHGAEDVEKDERAIREIVANKIAMRQSLYHANRQERQFRNHSAIETNWAERNVVVSTKDSEQGPFKACKIIGGQMRTI